MKPTIGRIVHVYDPAHKKPMAAIVINTSDVPEVEEIACTIALPGGGWRTASSVSPGKNPGRFGWEWPPQATQAVLVEPTPAPSSTPADETEGGEQ